MDASPQLDRAVAAVAAHRAYTRGTGRQHDETTTLVSAAYGLAGTLRQLLTWAPDNEQLQQLAKRAGLDQR